MATYHVDNSGGDGDGSEGSPWNNVAGHVNDLSAGDTMVVHGNASAPARIYTEVKINPTVNGISGSRITLRPYLSDLVIIRNNTGGDDHTFELDGDYWTIRDFHEIDHNGLWHYGIEVVAAHVQILDNTIHNSHNHNIVILSGYTHTEIRNNTMYDFDRSSVEDDAHGIMVKINADNTIIDGNTIHNCSGNSVQFQDGGWASDADNPTDCEITNNEFYRGTLVRGESSIGLKCSTNLLIADNVIHDFGLQEGDHGTAAGITIINQTNLNITIEDNTIYHCVRAMALGGMSVGGSIRRNLLYDFTDYAIQVTAANDLDMYNNTIVDAVGYGLYVATGGWTGGILKNNLWYNCGNLILGDGVTFTPTVEYNGRWDTNADAEFVDAETDTTGTGDPGFVDAANDDYRLLATSDAVDAGVPIGDEPYRGSAPDLGYDEYETPGVICMII